MVSIKPKLSNGRMFVKYLIMSIAFIGFGVLTFIIASISSFNTKGWIETTAYISKITSNDTWVKYVVDLVNYESRLNQYSSTWTINMPIQILYNPNNPYEIISKDVTMNVLLWIAGSVFAVVGLGLLISGIIKLAKANKNKDNNSSQNVYISSNDNDGSFILNHSYTNKPSVVPLTGGVVIDEVINEQKQEEEKKKEIKTYYFRPTSNMNRCKYVLEDENKKIVCESKREDINIFRGSLVSFRNNIKGDCQLHRYSNVIVQTEDIINKNYIIPASYKVDKVSIWELFESQGIKLTLSIDDKVVSYNVSKGEEYLGSISRASNILPSINSISELKRIKKIREFNILTDNVDNLSTLFFVAFSIAKFDRIAV